MSKITRAADIARKITINRWFVRCCDCLSVYAIEQDPFMCEVAPRCGACDGPLDSMGRVCKGGYLLVASYDECACDARCQGARGPNCDCACGGENHGQNVTFPVIQTEKGPRVQIKDADKARAIAAEWRAEVERCLTTRPARLARLSAAGEWLERSDWELARRYAKLIIHAHTLKTHAGRMKLLAKITEEGIGK